MENEIWKDVKGYEGCYKISNLGRVKSLKRLVKKWNGFRTVSEKILTNNAKMYNSVSLKRKQYYIHRLLAIHFIPNPENKPCINHINGIKTDNRLENLEWCTYYENNKHAFITGLNGSIQMSKKPVIQLLDGLIINEYISSAEASKMTGISQGNIHSVCKNNRHSAGGYKWKFKI